MSRRQADIWSHPGHYLVDPYTWPLDHFWSRYSKFHIWPWKLKVKVMAKDKPDGHIWGLKFNWYVCFSFRGNRIGLDWICLTTTHVLQDILAVLRGNGTIIGWDIANSIFDFDNSRSRSWPKSNPMVTFEAQSSIDMFAFRFVALGPFLAEI